MRRITSIVFATGTTLLVYGYLCREIHLYFFWDSKELGFFVLLISLLLYLISINKVRAKNGRKTFWVKAAIVVTSLGLLLGAYLVYDFKNSESYGVAKEYLRTDSELRNDVGNIQGFGLVPTGTIEETETTTSTDVRESGHASLTVTVMGNKKFKDVHVTLKENRDGWPVVSAY